MKNASDIIPDLIYDVGMNNGDDSAYYLHRGFRVVAVEAVPGLVEAARLRFRASIEAKRMIIENVGIAHRRGELPFWVCDSHSEWSSFDRSIASRDGSPHHRITVPCVRFDELLQQHGIPYYLKIDIEGNDALCLDALRPECLPTFISVEATDTGLLDRLHALGYTKFKCISQFHYLPLQRPESPAHRALSLAQRALRSRTSLGRVFRKLGGLQLARTYAATSRQRGGWQFRLGSSGPFGEELPGRWLSIGEMRETYEYFLDLKRKGSPTIYWTDAEYSFWCDFHATAV